MCGLSPDRTQRAVRVIGGGVVIRVHIRLVTPLLVSWLVNSASDIDIGEVHHVALVVADLYQSMRLYSETLGLTWAEPWNGPIPILVEGETHEPGITFTLSREGPPHLELIQSTAQGVWQELAPFHHIGFWTNEIDETVRDMTSNSFTVEVMSPTSDFVYLRSPDGARIELVNSRSQPDFARWLGGGRL